MADLREELAFAQQVVEDNILQLAATSDTTARQELLRGAIEALGVIAAAPETQGGEASRVERALGSQAINLDGLRLSLVEELSGTQNQSALQEARAVLLELKSPDYGAAGWTLLAHAEQAGGRHEEAERLVLRAIAEAKRITRAQTRDGALRAAVLELGIPADRSLAVETATDAMSDADARVSTYRDLARAEGEARKLSLQTEDLLSQSQTAIEAGSLVEALRLAQALDRENERRTPLLLEILDRAIQAINDRTATEAAKSVAGNKAQDKALRAIIDAHLHRDRPLRGLEIAPLLINPTARIDAVVAIAKGLEKAGYKAASLDTLIAVDPEPLPPSALSKLSVGLADVGAHAQALALAERLPAGSDRSFAFSRLAKRLSEEGDTEAAARLLHKVEAPADRSHVRVALGKAKAGAGQFDAALADLAKLASPVEQDSVLAAVALAHLDRGALDDARAVLHRIETWPSRAAVRVAMAVKAGTEAAFADLDQLITEAASRPGETASEILTAAAAAFAEGGAYERADRAAAALPGPQQRATTLGNIAQAAIRRRDVDEATRRAALLPQAQQGEVLGNLAFAAWEHHRDANKLLDALQPFPFQIRVPILRRVSEREAKRLDTHRLLAGEETVVEPLDAAQRGETADFVIGGHRLQAPVQPGTKPYALQIPASLSLTAADLRRNTPAPVGGEGQVAILGFSPFGLEAFKLTSSGNAAAYQVQVSQNLTWPHYIAVTSGTVTLGKLLRDLPETTRRRFLQPSGDALVIRAPIIILPGATLLMSGAEFGSYRLSSQSGSFIAVAGTLRVQDTEIVGFDEAKDAPAFATEADKALFRPFITAWGGSDLKIGGSRLAMLGYDSGKAYGLTQSSGAAVQSLYNLGSGSPTGEIVDNSFENLRYGYYSYEAEDVALIGNEYRDNIVYGIDPHDRSRRLVIALNTSYGAAKKHGIIVSREVDDSFIIGNMSLRNAGSGLMLDRLSQRNLIYANTSIDNGGDGLTFYESGCNFAAANYLANNARAGIKIRNSTDVTLQANGLQENKESGVDIYVADLRNSPEGQSRNFVLDPFEPLTTAALSANRFKNNGTGINVNGAGAVVLDRNHFENQRNRVYSGDFRPLSPYLLQLGNKGSLGVSRTCAQPEPKSHGSCSFNTIAPPLLVPGVEPAIACDQILPQNAAMAEKTNG